MSGVKFINHSGSRLLSLDLFRGWTIIGMILVNNPGSWTYMYAPLKHAKWDGWTPTDLIFPFFLWISGFAAALSLEKKSDSSRPLLYFTILRRSILLIAIGLFLSAFPFGLLASHTFSIETWRFPGVLQRIGTCYLISASLFLFGSYRLTLITSFIFLLSYTLLVEFFPVPGSGAGILSPNGSVFQYFDSLVLGSHVWSSSPAKGFDPEGIVSTLTAAVTMQSGILTYWIFKNQSRVSGIMRFTSTQILLITPGLILILAAYLLNFHCPINKNLWSISYVFLTSGTAMIAFFILHWFYDLKQFKFIKIFP
ncbi:MAG: heparan-alpha-glucosaminide N-acetyltransferase domain-containing protein, partial [Spirochaetia bacterium]|nr:heparan-alpha-glucosaminide N-acetyltransferase domain-containing protein [Spirochaetia bacterium]